MSYDLTGAAQGGNFVMSRAGGATANLSAVNGGAKTYTTQAMTYAVGGKLFFVAGAIGAVTPTTDGNTLLAFKPLAKNQGCAYLWGVNAAGVVSLYQGPMPVQPGSVATVTNVDDNGNYTVIPPLPTVPDTITPIAYMFVRLQSTYAGTGFVPGISDNWNATGVVTTTADVFSLPSIPQTA
jgi:hypothetical protein